MAIDEKALVWMVTALKESHADERRHHDESVTRPQKQYQTLQNRLDAMYVDKLDGKISQDYFDRQSGLWREEQSKLSAQILAHQNANINYIDAGVNTLELAQGWNTLRITVDARETSNFVFCTFELGLEGWSSRACVQETF